jgi:hypothetical protein
MTNNPRNPLPGDQPQDPQQGFGTPPERQAPSGQQPSGQQPARGATTPSSASGATPASASPPSQPTQPTQPRTRYQEPRTQQTTYQTSQPTVTRTREAPRRPNNNKRIALYGILGLAAVAGIITGFAATNNHSSPVAAVHRVVLPTHVRHVPARTSGRLLETFTGVGARTSTPFTVTNPSTVHYGYRCSSGTGTFRASMATTGGANRQVIASTSGAGTSAVTTVHPSSTGSTYRITANSSCPYFIRVYGR